MLRTHQAGTLTSEHVGQTVSLAGWVAKRRDHGGVAFIDLRDASGICQVVVRDEYLASAGIHDLRNEFCIQVTGVVDARTPENVNPNIATGEVEVAIRELEVLNPAAPLPFQIDERTTVGEDARLKHRYLDLRRPRQHEALVLRSKVTRAIREVLDGRDFHDIETPTLTRSTPEGARDFVVPARLHPGKWYALPQSPQLFKQLLMVAGMERYYQIARCYRDEDFRADRQPEFTQLDIEMSFVDQDDVIALAEEVMAACWRLIGVEMQTPLPRMTWHDAMDDYGSDKPDLRFDLKIRELTAFFADTPFRVFQAAYVGGVVMPGGASLPRRQFDAWQEWAKQRGARGLAYITVGEDGELGGPVAKNISEAERAGIAEAMGANPGDAIFFAAGARESSQELLGAARLEIGRRCNLIPEDAWSFLWIVDAPMFKSTTDEGRRRRRRWREVDGGAPRVHLAEAGVRGHLRHRPRVGAQLRLRLCLQRQRGGRRLHPYPPPRRAGARVRRHGHRRGGGAGEVRLPPRRVLVRRPAARRHRLRPRPARDAARRLRLDPRRHRLPEERRRVRPADRGPGADHRAAAQGSRRRREAGAEEGLASGEPMRA